MPCVEGAQRLFVMRDNGGQIKIRYVIRCAVAGLIRHLLGLRIHLLF